MAEMKYNKRGVSSEKEDVHNAIKNIDKGLFPKAFCKVLPDYVAHNPEYALIMHADTAGTKTALAYLYWKETGDLSVWKGIVQDAIVMNLDDMACAGALNDFVLSSTIGRNKNLISGDVIKTIIHSAYDFAGKLGKLGINIALSGGETADVGDIVRTIDVGFTAFARLKREEIITVNPQHGDVIVGFESCGQANYEEDYNSGIGCNGLTFARHELLCNDYAEHFPESYDPIIEKKYVYSGKMRLQDSSYVESKNIGQLLLSPTRTYLPLLKAIIENYKAKLHGIVHCTGGGQTKVLHFIDNLHVIKNDLLPVPPVFQHIQEQSGDDYHEMFRVFNMGQRLEIYTDEQSAVKIIELAKTFSIHSKICGYFENSDSKKLTVIFNGKEFLYY